MSMSHNSTDSSAESQIIDEQLVQKDGAVDSREARRHDLTPEDYDDIIEAWLHSR
jgi:hypothetical protein